MDQHLNILVQSSDYYAPFAGVMLTSLFENNQDIDHITVYLMTSDMSEKNRGRFRVLAEKYQRAVKFIDMKEIDCLLANNQAPRYHGAYTPYYKIFALSVIKVELDRLIYMDSDMIVDGSLAELLTFDLQGNALGMCLDAIPASYKKHLGSPASFYCNTGFIIFDVEKWKSEKWMEKVLEHMLNDCAAYPIADQDLLNVVFAGKVAILPLKYNFNTGALLFAEYSFYKKVYGIKDYYSEEEFYSALKRPIVLHYIGPFNTRPWIKSELPGKYWPAKELWKGYQRQSLWKDVAPIQQSMPPRCKIQYTIFRITPKSFFAFANRISVYCFLKLKAFCMCFCRKLNDLSNKK